MLTLRRLGITTGAAAAAAAKAAALCLGGEAPRSVTIPTPVGLRLEIPVERVYRSGEQCCGEVRKFSGDNPDALDGVLVRVCVKPGSGGLKITCGEGVGIVTRPGLPVPPGECAINPIPRLMIAEALREAGLAEGTVLVEVPGGERLAELTMNRDVGIVGGISILGTTGIEFPTSSKEYVMHIRAELEAVRAVSRAVVLAVGNRAVQYARRDFGDAVVKAGDWIGAAVNMAARMGFEAVTVAGLPGKLVKVAAGAMNTHSRYCDARLETLTYCALTAGVPHEVVTRVLGAGSVAEALHHLEGYRDVVLSAIARRAKERLVRLAKRGVRVVVYDESGRRAAEA